MKKISFFIPIALLLVSCVSLKEINSFAKSSSTTLQSVADNELSFSSGYLKQQSWKQFLEIPQDEISINKFSLPVIIIDDSLLKTFQEADQTILLFANSLQAYLGSLVKLSDNDLVKYDFSKVGEALKANPAALAQVGISATDIDAALTISKVGTDAIMGKYREKKLRSVIINYDAPFQRTANRLIAALTILSHNLNNDIGSFTITYGLVLKNPNLPMTPKFEWRKEYRDGIIDLKKKSLAINKLIAAIQKIKMGHGDIATKLATSKLNSKIIITALKEHAAEIRSLYSSFKQLIN